VNDKPPLAAGSGPEPTAPSKPFTVRVADNFHYMDESETYTQGSYATYEEALKVCQQFVLHDLTEASEPGRPAAKVLENYHTFGSDPFIVGPDTGAERFSAWDYARQECAKL
jgi:hypothetical protein